MWNNVFTSMPNLDSHKKPEGWGLGEDAPPKKLDDGWPESVEEQGLLLLVWRHNFTNNI